PKTRPRTQNRASHRPPVSASKATPRVLFGRWSRTRRAPFGSNRNTVVLTWWLTSQGPRSMADLRFALVGFGAWGVHRARAISSVPQASLTAICSRSDESRNRARADHPQARVYADYQEMLAKEELDAVDVVLPSDLHYAVACDVLSSG